MVFDQDWRLTLSLVLVTMVVEGKEAEKMAGRKRHAPHVHCVIL